MVASMDVESHLQRLDLLLSKLANANLKLTPAKCELMKKKVEFVGITISEKGISVNNKRVSAVQNIPAPRTLKESYGVPELQSQIRKEFCRIGKTYLHNDGQEEEIFLDPRLSRGI